MSILNRYFLREISKPLAVVLGILSVLFLSYSTVGFLSDAVNGLVPTDTIIRLVLLKGLISLEVLIPISLYISVIVALGRMHSESEIVAMFALTLAPKRIIAAVLFLSAGLALAVGGVSMFGRPWAYGQLHQFSAAAESSINFDDMQAGVFYEDKHGRWVIFIGHRSSPRAIADDVFIRSKVAGRYQTIYAQHGHQLPQTTATDRRQIQLSDARVYQISDSAKQPDLVLAANDMVLDLDLFSSEPPGYSSVAASTRTLAASGTAADTAELQWRLSTPVSIFLLGMLGVPLSRSQPRQGRFAKMGLAISVYVAYYLLCASARIWVQRGAVAAFPGIWWAPALLALLIAAMTLRRGPGLSIFVRGV